MRTMQLNFQSQWMKAQKHADVMAPDGHFDVIQTIDETSMFFSLGTDDILWLTKELQTTNVGWNREDLSSRLSASFSGAKVRAKAFAVSQNTVNGKWDLVLVATIGDADHLFLSQNNDYSASHPAIVWTQVPFDAEGETTSKLQIADVFVMNVPVAGSTCVVDIVRLGGSNNSLDRYFIMPGQATKWRKHLLATDLDAGSVTSVLGQRVTDRVAGMYTFGSINGKVELIYAPLYNAFRPDVPAAPARLTLPTDDATAIASAFDHAGHSSLFVAHATGVSVFPPDKQADGATATSCLSGPLVAGAAQIQAMTVSATTSIWGRNAQGGLFYATCPAGSETKAASWSAPVLLLPQVEQFAFYNGLSTKSHTLFAHINAQKIIELDQDPITTTWRQRSIILPSTGVDDMVEFDSFTTRIEVDDDNHLAQSNVEVSFTSISPVPVYIDDVYYVLNSKTPISIKTDRNGSITIVQQTDSLSAVCYNASLGSVSALIDPASSMKAKLQSIQSGDDLGAVQVTDSTCKTKPLIASSVSAGDKNAAAQAIKQFSDIGKTLNPDGSRTTNAITAKTITPSAGQHVMTLAVNRATIDAQRLAITQPVDPPSIESIAVAVGDFFKMLGNKILQGLQTLEVRIVDGLHYVFARIGDVVYHALLDCLSAIAHAMQWVFQQIKILWDDLVAWLGFIFGWKDIVRTHKVMKNLIKQYVRSAFDSIDSAEQKISEVFEGIETKVNMLTGVEDNGITVGSVAKKNPSDGSSSPQSHWGINHAKAHLSNATTKEPSNNAGGSVLEDLQNILKDLEALVENEGDYFKTAYKQLNDQVVAPYLKLTAVQVAQRLMGIVSDFLLKSAKNILVKLLDIIKLLAELVLDILDAPINIPIISPLYNQVANADLSVLDLLVLIVSIPATIVYKIATETTPFPDDKTTDALINATSFEAIKSLAKPGPKDQPAMPLLVRNEAIRKPAGMPNGAVQPSLASNGIIRAVSTANDGDRNTTDTYRVFSSIGRFMGAFTAVFNQVYLDAEWLHNTLDDNNEPLSLPFSWKMVGTVNQVTSQIPAIITTFDHTGSWEVVMTTVATNLNTLRSLLGAAPLLKSSDPWKKKIDPALQMTLQFVLLPPLIGLLIEGPADPPSKAVSFCASAFTRLAGFLNPLTTLTDDPDPAEAIVSMVILSVANVCTGLQSCLMIASGIMICKGT